MDSVIVMQGSAVLEEEDELVALVGRLAVQSRCERVAAYRQLQATSHMTQQLNGRSLANYDVPYMFNHGSLGNTRIGFAIAVLGLSAPIRASTR